MCIIFSYISRRFKSGEFKLIILSNRDEYFNRPSKAASFVNEHNVYGMDLTAGKEGGTWLGLNRYGKISALVNLDRLDYADDDMNKAGRGFLVPDFLNGKFNSIQYAETIKIDDKKYNPFNLIFYEKNNDNLWKASIYDNYNSTLNIINSEFLCVSNHVYDKPYQKTIIGEQMFKGIVTEFNQIDKKHLLINKLLELAKYDAGKKFEDVFGDGENAIRQMMREQVFINIPNYGTRTHTVILVDDKDQVTYVEKTLKLTDLLNPIWEDSLLEFELKND